MKKILKILGFGLIIGCVNAKGPVNSLGEVVMGSPKAPLLIQNYSSLTCGHCAQFHVEILPKLQEKYIKTNRVRYVFRHFPTDKLAIQATALILNMPVISAKKPEEVIHEFFKRQSEWIEAKDPLPIFSEITGMKPEKCKKIIEDEALLKQALHIRIDIEKHLPIDGTPYLLVNGRILNYAPSWHELDAICSEKKRVEKKP